MTNQSFHPVIFLPIDIEVYDFSSEYNPDRPLRSPFGIGRYNEKRPGMYKGELFQAEQRDIHVGIDIAAPIGTPIHSFSDAEVFLFHYNSLPGDYGYTLITKNTIQEETLYVLYGHLSARSIEKKEAGQLIKKGDVIAWVGDKHENGGWNPHLHFQISRQKPEKCDMPGVVNERDREEALRIYPDPRIVLGPIY